MPSRPEVAVDVARASDLDDLVRLESNLFRDDAGAHDPLVDTTWPARHARDDFARLIDGESTIVLVARYDEHVRGHLVGYLSAPSRTRFDRRTAEIRSLYVDGPVRTTGIGQALVTSFTTWARTHEAVAVTVSAYAANDGARAFYKHLGFAEQTVAFRLLLDAQ
ncbi:GNAT family N-acetyltransferase [Kribbella sp.]|uniref:GNAT family N-acetyltransferase n=1 Tax=Kribbella sp. TaxID=1871183 RepID=UPI002D65757A|nr:GNAT family N-acetyltransferase [Kribbella sp.]HZX02088.1 GNAT family N-acetyltransferase [Kribbella sp.]